MGTSKRAFTQVRDILRKIDRSIDDVRSRRLGDQEPSSAPQPARPMTRLSSDQPLKAQRRAQPRSYNGGSAFGEESNR